MSIDRHRIKLNLLSCLVSIITSCVCIGALPQPASAADSFELGKAEFQLKRYNAARERFMTAIAQNPSNQKAYLYLGRTLEFLKEPEDAQATYRACFSINPFSDEGKQAKQCSLDIAGRQEAREHRAIDTPGHVVDSGLLIQRQSLELQARKIREAQAYSRNRRNVNRRQGYFYSPYELTNRNPDDEMSDREFIRNGHGIYDNMNEGQRARLYGAKNAQNVQDTANALIERLGQKTKNSPALRAFGTNLYVQYYRSKNEEDDLIPPPVDPQIELRARQWKIGEARKPQSRTIEEALFDEANKPGKKRSPFVITPTSSTVTEPPTPTPTPRYGVQDFFD